MTGSPKLVGPDPVQLHMDIWHAVNQLAETRLFGSAEADYPRASSTRTRLPSKLIDSAPTIVTRACDASFLSSSHPGMASRPGMAIL